MHSDLRCAAFDSYALGWSVLSTILRPSPDPEQAYICMERIRMELMPASSCLDEPTMESLNTNVAPFAQSLTLDAVVAANMSVAERTHVQRVLNAIANRALGGGGSSSISAPSSVSGPSVSAAGEASPVVQNAEWTTWLNSTEVRTLESEVDQAMAQDPVPTIIIVNRLHRSREPLVVQLLHTRGNIPGSAPLSRVKELRTHCRKTMSYCVTASPDPTDPDGKKLVVHKRWVSFLMSKQAFNDLFTANWHAFDPHQLIYELGHAKKPETVKVVVSKILRWGHHVDNSSVSVFLDRAFHFMGYENGVFSDFIAPVQAILVDTAKFR